MEMSDVALATIQNNIKSACRGNGFKSPELFKRNLLRKLKEWVLSECERYGV
jgi:hypothetical protein